jgi:trimeric autotransporter adhesin
VRVAAVIAAGWLTGSCAESTVETVPVISVVVTPTAAALRVGGTTALVARSFDANSNPIDAGFTWSTSNRLVATVSGNGIVTAIGPGEAQIAVSTLGKSATAAITVTPRTVATVAVSPATVTTRVGATVPLQAITLDDEAGALTGRVVVWASSNVAVATVNAQGVVTGIAPGAATVTATSEGRVGQSAVTVTVPPVATVTVAPAADTVAVGIDRPHTVVLRDAAGATLTGRAVAWSSSNVAVATVTSTGTVTGRAPGTATIAATSEGRVGTASVIILARPADAVTLTPETATLVVGTTQRLTAQVTDAIGNLVAGRQVTYTSSAATIARVDTSGLVTAVAAGTARITATSQGKTAVTTITVIPVPVATVTLTPATATVLTATTRQLSVVSRAANGTTLTGRVVTWATGAPGVASVSNTGLVTGVAPGVAIILATVEGISAASTITVVLPTVASVTVAPAAPIVSINGNVQLTATPLTSAGATLTGRTVTWSSADESIAFVSSSGLVVGFKAGTVRITALVEGVSASVLVTVR